MKDNLSSENDNYQKDKYFQNYKEIVEHSIKQIDWTRSAYKWAFGIITSIITIFLLASSWLTYSSLKELKSDINDFKKSIRDDIDITTKNIKSNLLYDVNDIRIEVKNRIGQEFDNKNIHELVEKQIELRIGKIVDSLITMKVDTKLRPYFDTTLFKITNFNNELAKAKNTLKTMDDVTSFTMKLLKAQNDNREAYEQLIKQADDPNSKFKDISANAIIKVRTDYSSVIEPGYLNINWKEQFKKEDLTIEDYNGLTITLPPLFHADIVNNVWSNNKISKYNKLKFLVNILENDESLTAVYYAGKYLSQESTLKWQPFNIDPIIKWWNNYLKNDLK